MTDTTATTAAPAAATTSPSWITGLENWWAATEADAVLAIAKFKAGVAWAEGELEKGLEYVNNNASQINSVISEINGVLGVAAAQGLVPKGVDSAITLANQSVAALNAYRQTLGSAAATDLTAQANALVAGYGALKTAQNAQSIAALSIVNLPTPAPATSS